MVELRELLRGIPRPTASHLRVRAHSRVGVLARRIAPFGVMWGACLLLFIFSLRDGNSSLAQLAAKMVQPLPLVLVFVLLFAIIFLRIIQLRRLVRANVEGILLLATGRTDTSAELYDDLARRVRGRNPYHALFVGNRGVVATIQGELELGRTLLAEALRSRWLTRESPSFPGGYFAAWLARSHALAGDLRTAQSFRDVASEFLPSGRRATLLIVDVLLLLRSGHASAAADTIAGGWMGAEGELAAHERRVLRTLQAFALSKVPGREPEVELALAGLWPPIPGLEYLGVAWPEMREFVATRTQTRAEPDAIAS